MSVGLVFIDKGGRLPEYNKSFLELFDPPANALVPGVSIDAFVGVIASYRGWSAEKREMVVSAMTTWVQSDAAFGRECEMEDGRIYLMQCRPMQEQGIVLTFDDVSRERQASRDLSYSAYHDALTGLGNCRALRERKLEWLRKGRYLHYC